MTIQRKTFNRIIYTTLILILLLTCLSLTGNIIFCFLLILATLVYGLTLVVFGLDEDDIKDAK